MYVAGGLAVVDEQRDLHRIGGRRDSEHFARHVVFADDEVGWTEVRHRCAGFVQDADIQRPLDGLRDELSLADDGERGEQGRDGQRASIVHDGSIGPAFRERQGRRTAKMV